MIPARIPELHRDSGWGEQQAPPPVEEGGGRARERSTWTPIPLAQHRGGPGTPPPSVLARDDGQRLLYAGKVNAVYGESESMKSWLLLLAASQELDAGRHVLWVDFEDDPATVDQRLQQLGADTDRIDSHFHYLRPDEPLVDRNGRVAGALGDFQQAAQDWPHTLAVLDGITEALGLHGYKTNDADDFAAFNRLVPRWLADLGAAVGTVDHVTKDSQTRGKYALGSQHKRAATSGAGLQIEMTEPFGIGRAGIATVTIAKDKPGHLRRNAAGKVIAELRLTSSADTGGIRSELRALGGADLDLTPWDGPTQCMAAVLHWMQANPGERVAKSAMPDKLRAAGAGSYRDKTVREALERLAAAGTVNVASGPRGGTYFYYGECGEWDNL